MGRNCMEQPKTGMGMCTFLIGKLQQLSIVMVHFSIIEPFHAIFVAVSSLCDRFLYLLQREKVENKKKHLDIAICCEVVVAVVIHFM